MGLDVGKRAGMIVQPVAKQSGSAVAGNSFAGISEPCTHGLALLLAVLALAVHAIIVADGHYDGLFYGWLAIELLVVLSSAWAFRRHVVRRCQQWYVSPLLVLAALVAFIWEWCTRQFFDVGHPSEIVAMNALRNLVIGLAVFSVWAAQQRLLVMFSLFLAMFGLMTTKEIVAHWFAGLFALAAMTWLMTSHWEHVRRGLRGHREKARLPRRAILALLLLLLLPGFLLGIRDRGVTSAVRGFLRSSGGSGEADRFARRGVGDGEQLVAGTDRVQSFAPIDDAPFLEDDQPSLYDMLDDTYEEALKNKNNDRAISLSLTQERRTQEHLHSQVEKANREFSTLRQRRDPNQPRQVKDIRSDAVLYVAGRVPLHLRLQVYDTFDGATWYPQQQSAWQQPLEVVVSNGKPWLRLHDRGESREFLARAETHALKIVRLETNVIPAPLYLHGVHIDLVDRVEMYKHGPDGLIALARERIPGLVPIHIASRAIRWNALPVEAKMFLPVRSDSPTVTVPEQVNCVLLRELAEEWCRGVAPGWAQIQAIRERLRSDYLLDADWRPQLGRRSGVEQFLFEAKRGPDYQFATAAALLLRSLGYQTRVVSGFYADPKRYEAASRHTPVLPSDLHFWAEVRMIGGDWITLEATPGYELLSPPPGFWGVLWQKALLVWVFGSKHWRSLALTALIVLLGRWQRHLLADLWLTARWEMAVRWSPEQAIGWTLQLLRARAMLAGHPPGRAVTHHQWLGDLQRRLANPALVKQLNKLKHEVDVVAYGRHWPTVSSESLARCRDVVRACTLQWFRQHTEPVDQVVTGPPPRQLASVGEIPTS